MSELNLLPDARSRLLQCYLLLISLADEAKKDTDTDSDLVEGNESTNTTEEQEVLQLDNDTADNESKQGTAQLRDFKSMPDNSPEIPSELRMGEGQASQPLTKNGNKKQSELQTAH